MLPVSVSESRRNPKDLQFLFPSPLYFLGKKAVISPESGVRFKTVCQALRLIPNTDLNEQIEDPHYLQDGTKEGFLLVPANSNEYQEGQDPQRFFTRAPQNHHPLKKRYTIAFPGLGPSMTSWHASVEPSLTLLRYAALTLGGV